MADVKVSKADREKLTVVRDLNGAKQAAYLPTKLADKLAKAGVIDKHPTDKNADGDALVKITAAGTELLTKFETATPRVAPSVPEGGFEIVSGFTMPAPTGRGRREATYPFDKLEIGQSFFIPATAERPTPAKSMGSTVSSANRRYADATPKRFFRVAEVEHKGVKGAMVQRMEPPAAS